MVALQNPVSKRRREQLDRPRDILLEARPPNTPMVLARNLGRDGGSVRIKDLLDLGPDDADILAVIVIANRQKRVAERGLNR
ncbi:MAG: hypothetical protein QF902_02985 [Rhodospirillales bacterium]|nr:hypothetical protein [Rhodospirillales bacterium]